MSKLILCVGISNSGKSTWAEQYLASNPNAVELNRDHIRFRNFPPGSKWDDYEYTEHSETQVSFEILKLYYKALKENKDIIVSDTNLSPFIRNTWLNRALENKQSVEFVVFNSYFIDLFYANSTNLMYVPNHVIESQYKNFTRFLEERPIPGIKYTMI